jgi:rhodanese-related sulfurtransferase
MEAAGFSHVYDLVGGIGAWESNGGQVVTGRG